jgi:hypothetical protein
MPDTTLIVSLAGIGASGVVGPAATGWATRRATRQQFERELARERHDDLAGLIDEAARLLSYGATNLRLIASAKSAGPSDAARASGMAGLGLSDGAET